MGSFKLRMHHNPFSAGAPPRYPLGELTTLPRSPSRLGIGTPLRIRSPPPRRLRHLDLAAIPLLLKEIYANDTDGRQTDRQTDRRTDGRMIAVPACKRSMLRQCTLSVRLSVTLVSFAKRLNRSSLEWRLYPRHIH